MSAKYAVGDAVTVRQAYPPGHVRTPYFIRGHQGVVQEVVGNFANPEELAYGRDGKRPHPLSGAVPPRGRLAQIRRIAVGHDHCRSL